MAKENKAADAPQPVTISATVPTTVPQTDKVRKSIDPKQSTYSADQIIDGYRAFDYPKVIVIAAIQTDGRKQYTQSEAKAVIEAFARRDPLANNKGGK